MVLSLYEQSSFYVISQVHLSTDENKFYLNLHSKDHILKSKIIKMMVNILKLIPIFHIVYHFFFYIFQKHLNRYILLN